MVPIGYFFSSSCFSYALFGLEEKIKRKKIKRKKMKRKENEEKIKVRLK